MCCCHTTHGVLYVVLERGIESTAPFLGREIVIMRPWSMSILDVRMLVSNNIHHLKTGRDVKAGQGFRLIGLHRRHTPIVTALFPVCSEVPTIVSRETCSSCRPHADTGR